MSLRSLQVVLRSLADAEPPASDADLLRRFLGGDAEAFAELVRRHGRLVWAVCRHLTGSDAEADDAFQATFLVLLRGAGKVRDAGRLSAWLHGVAYKVCAKARRAAKRRTTREHAVALRERNGTPVPDSAWDRALAAVHEEVGALPETLRVPFVLCCLEGKGVTEAAAQLGWKLGTFSGRLTRAKDLLLARLETRGLTIGAVAGLGLVAPPTTAMAKASALARAGFAVPNSVLQLTQGVLGMSLTSFKVLAAAVLLTAGLGFGVGNGWVATADAQPPAKPASAKPDPEAEVRRLQAELDRAKMEQDAERARWTERMVQKGYLSRAALTAAEAQTEHVSKWEYDFVAVKDLTQAQLVKFLRDREAQGWEFIGTTPVTPVYEGGSQGVPAANWVFRKPAKTVAAAGVQFLGSYLAQNAAPGNGGTGTRTETQPAKPADPNAKPMNSALSAYNRAMGERFNPSPDDAKAIEAEIARLQARLAALKKPSRSTRMFASTDLPLEPTEVTELLTKLAAKKFKPERFRISTYSSDAAGHTGVMVEGDQEVIDWATAMLKKLAEK